MKQLYHIKHIQNNILLLLIIQHKFTSLYMYLPFFHPKLLMYFIFLNNLIHLIIDMPLDDLLNYNRVDQEYVM